MDELIRKTFYKPYLQLNKHSDGIPPPALASCKNLFILHEGWSPTLAYFEEAIKSRCPEARSYLVDTLSPPNLTIPDGAAIVIIRFISVKWQLLLKQHLKSSSRIIYFMDDDLLDPAALSHLPKKYRVKIIKHSAAQHHWITEYCDEFWVSTPYLANKYEHLNPIIVIAKPSSLLLASRQPVKIAYHGSSSHRAEKLWLREVINGVLASCPHVSFEIFGEHDIYKLYRDLPNVSVLHPMNWQNYLSYTSTHRVDIGLAPLLDSPFNLARGAIKFYDFVRMGAVGIYTNRAPYSDIVEQNINGILLENDPQLWIKTIVLLAEQTQKRVTLARFAKKYAQRSVTV